MIEREVRRQRRQRLRAHQGVFREGAKMERTLDRTPAPARSARMRAAGAEARGIEFVSALAQCLGAAHALETRAARNRPVQQHRLAGHEAVDTGADRIDAAGAFVAEHERPRPAQRGMIGVTDAGGGERNAHLAGSGRIHLDRIDDETAGAVADQGGSADGGAGHARSNSTGFFGVSMISPTAAPGHQRSQSACCILLTGACKRMSRSM